MKTLALDDNWDLLVTAGSLVAIDRPAAIAQDVASAVRLFKGELWYDTTQGIPYFKDILGHVPTGVTSAQFVAAGLTVPGVVRIRCALDPLGASRRLTGSLTITDDRAVSTTVFIANPNQQSNVLLDTDGTVLLDDDGKPLLDSPIR